MTTRPLSPLTRIIFASRWLQLPLYFGLIVVQALYVLHFLKEVWGLLVSSAELTETTVMVTVLDLIDMLLISNLIVMVTLGGYETFVSRLDLKGHPDEPEWLDHVSPGSLKIKLALSLVGISSINLLKAFIDINNQTDHAIYCQCLIFGMFIVCALMTAWIDRLTSVRG